MRSNRARGRFLCGGRGRLMFRSAVAVGAAVGVLAGGSVPAWATTSDPYSSTPYGYDVSYPQCPGTSVPAAPNGENYSFAIVGVGGGRPFTSNSCAGAETLAATQFGISNVALYFNTGYAGAYSRNITSTCAGYVSAGDDVGVTELNLKGHALSAAQEAWEIGCSEALYAQANAPAVTPTMWWADVETGNSWSTNTSLNDFTIDGLSYGMQAGGLLGGFYSYTSAWSKIAGSGFTPTPAESGNWVAFTGDTLNNVKNFVVQNGTSGGADTDLGY